MSKLRRAKKVILLSAVALIVVAVGAVLGYRAYLQQDVESSAV